MHTGPALPDTGTTAPGGSTESRERHRWIPLLEETCD
jgi:hypothetical protein